MGYKGHRSSGPVGGSTQILRVSNKDRRDQVHQDLLYLMRDDVFSRMTSSEQNYVHSVFIYKEISRNQKRKVQQIWKKYR